MITWSVLACQPPTFLSGATPDERPFAAGTRIFIKIAQDCSNLYCYRKDDRMSRHAVIEILISRYEHTEWCRSLFK